MYTAPADAKYNIRNSIVKDLKGYDHISGSFDETLQPREVYGLTTNTNIMLYTYHITGGRSYKGTKLTPLNIRVEIELHYDRESGRYTPEAVIDLKQRAGKSNGEEHLAFRLSALTNDKVERVLRDHGYDKRMLSRIAGSVAKEMSVDLQNEVNAYCESQGEAVPHSSVGKVSKLLGQIASMV